MVRSALGEFDYAAIVRVAVPQMKDAPLDVADTAAH